ncbi:MAG: hypothetical protein H0T53_09455 [Herpetosiphonaceae bacterium]|nr:hypothetical protein [Herpetosiphonaceae bacterium]
MRQEIDILLEANTARLEARYHDAFRLYLNLGQAIELDPDLMLVLAILLWQISSDDPDLIRHQQALDWIDKAIQRAPHRVDFYLTRGDILLYGADAPQYAAAIQDYRRAITRDPTHAQAAMSCASLVGLPEPVITYPEAIAILEHAITIHQERGDLFRRLGTLYHGVGDRAAAQQAYRRALLCGTPLPLRDLSEITAHCTE